MRLSSATTYAIRAVVYLAASSANKVLPAYAIASEQSIPSDSY
jgi:DNA-binding IscR family transcriptional regulator